MSDDTNSSPDTTSQRPDWRVERDARNAKIDAALESLGLEYSAAFIPQSQSRNAQEKQPILNWTITIKKGRTQLQTDYTQGIAHLPGYGKLPLFANSIGGVEYFRRAAETGRYVENPVALVDSPCASWKGKPIPAPLLRDVMYCLLRDADTLDYASYEDWAGDMGYDPDSRSGEKTYREGLALALKIRVVLGDDTLKALNTVYEGY